MSRAAIEALGEAIDRALDDAPVTDVLAFITGVFVGLTIELLRREGQDVDKEIRIDGVEQRDIAIHAPKVMQ
ncbi:hypothetical protein SB394_11800 [Burkholderia sp. BCCIQ04A]|uniref:Uncharacterized protein n=1 Tax=Burkholderia anthinoferrum TaxID=3090833 RepID=A0ABU5WNV6_9BURK|nr:hypothetical protein [Burkholderia anthinoferrum]MEB2504595.1 hypothetical protein [Burkholderia anthinoferrum]MEB2530264.1 hypothetical protein [Burkholderia anthinoferrum]MEB2561637.1 hypothetical protein [Burkholderia anthinoferrum]MEB2580613.1 hypothetical protein [Burkholderia anthinoferrum]MEB2634409.1 hypothetical protein [Burkholderia anthinoferrum]